MSYNWPEIFKNKTEKELYKIYIGDSFLPDSTRAIAESELKKRGFNFKDHGYNLQRWEEQSLKEEIDDEMEQLLKINKRIKRNVYSLFLSIVLVCINIILSLLTD